MAKNDATIWLMVGALIGMITSAVVNSRYAFIGALLGGVIGYVLGKNVK